MNKRVNKKVIRVAIAGVIASVVLIGSSSCSLFKKPDCDWDCPWGDDVTDVDSNCKLICDGKEVEEK